MFLVEIDSQNQLFCSNGSSTSEVNRGKFFSLFSTPILHGKHKVELKLKEGNQTTKLGLVNLKKIEVPYLEGHCKYFYIDDKVVCEQLLVSDIPLKVARSFSVEWNLKEEQLALESQQNLRKSSLKSKEPHLMTINCVIQRLLVDGKTYSFVCFGAPHKHGSNDEVLDFFVLKANTKLKQKMLNLHNEYQIKKKHFNSKPNAALLARVLEKMEEICMETIQISNCLKQYSFMKIRCEESNLKSQNLKTMCSETMTSPQYFGDVFDTSLALKTFLDLDKRAKSVNEDCQQLLDEHYLYSRYQKKVMSDISFSQLLGAVCTGFWELINECSGKFDFSTFLSKVGYFCQFESLLSLYGTEKQMFNSLQSSIERLQNMEFELKQGPKDFEISESKVIFSFEEVKDVKFKVFCVVFNRGINEVQRILDLGSNSEQKSVNLRGLERLREFLKKFEFEWPQTKCGSTRKQFLGFLNQKLQKIEKDLLVSSSDWTLSVSDVTRIFGSIYQIQFSNCCLFCSGYGFHPQTSTRFTLCKSAKDRTSMSVTLEESYILKQQTNRVFLAALRSCGTRLLNVFDNIGSHSYAFNIIQRNLLQEQYRPPKHTTRQLES